MMKNILLVDDEEEILKAIVRLFFDTDYEVITAESGTEALDILKKQEVNLIISDMRMPDMDGYVLLSKVKALYPETVRIILSGYSEENIILDTLQKNILYMLKPWDNQTLIRKITRLLEASEILKNANLLTQINNISHLPTCIEHYECIMNLIDSGANLGQISAEIEKDMSISTRILRVANAICYGMKTGSIKRAVSYVGMENLKRLVSLSSVIDTKSYTRAEGEVIENINQHAYLSNRLLHFLYEKHLNKRLPDKYDSVGLLHNIGMIIFLKYFPDRYIDILIKAKKNPQDLITLEKEVFSISHDEVGRYVLQWGEFPDYMQEITLFHHRPMDGSMEYKEIIFAVHIVGEYAVGIMNKMNEQNGIAGEKCEIEIEAGKAMSGLDARAFEVLGISQEIFEESMCLFEL